MITVLPIDTAGLGDRTYLAHDGEVAFVVDPVSFEHVGVRDGEVLEVGRRMRVRVLHTPGHTHTHLSFALEVDGEPVAVFTGGSLLYGSSGRPDLLGPDHTQTLAHAQWHSARRLAAELSDDTEVYPTHGFGSFCSATESSGTASTIGQEKRTNPALTTDEARYVHELIAGLDAFPAYYAHMAPLNSAGPAEVDLSAPAQADPAELCRRIEAGEWVVDLRTGTAFAAGHVAGTVSFGIDGQFVTYLGWLLPWGTPVTLLGETADDVARAQRELVRIGIDRPAAMATGKPEEWAGERPLRSFPRATYADLAAALAKPEPPVVLDVRRDQERAEAFLTGSVHDPRGPHPSRRDPDRNRLGVLRRRVPGRGRGRVARRPRPRRRRGRRGLHGGKSGRAAVDHPRLRPAGGGPMKGTGSRHGHGRTR